MNTWRNFLYYHKILNFSFYFINDHTEKGAFLRYFHMYVALLCLYPRPLPTFTVSLSSPTPIYFTLLIPCCMVVYYLFV